MIERIVLDQPYKCFSENNILYNFQFGFRQNPSTILCLTHLLDKILKRFDEGFLTGMLYIDLQKAFDTTNRDVLLQKLKSMRLSEQSIQWFSSCLCDRIFLVETENKLSGFGFCKDFFWISSEFYPGTLSLFCFRFMSMICLKQYS